MYLDESALRSDMHFLNVIDSEIRLRLDDGRVVTLSGLAAHNVALEMNYTKTFRGGSAVLNSALSTGPSSLDSVSLTFPFPLRRGNGSVLTIGIEED